MAGSGPEHGARDALAAGPSVGVAASGMRERRRLVGRQPMQRHVRDVAEAASLVVLRLADSTSIT